MIKRVLSILICLAIGICLVGCAGDNASTSKEDSSSTVSTIKKPSKQPKSSQLTSYAVTQKTKVNIMPLGDSLTQGGQHKTSAYRGYLSTMLKDGGHNSVFVGCHNWSYDSITDGNWMHSGFGGATVKSLSGDLDKMTECNPDIILLLVGRNDNTRGNSAEETVKNLDELLIDPLYKMFPDVHIFLANPPPIRHSNGSEMIYPGDNIMKTYLPAYEQYVADKKATGAKIDFVEMSEETTGLTWEDYTAEDFVHPLPQGYEKMAKVWYEAIKDLVAEIQKSKEDAALKG